jgi:ERCC4-related helicase
LVVEPTNKITPTHQMLDFFKRHKKKIIGGTIALGVLGVVVYYYNQRVNEENIRTRIKQKMKELFEQNCKITDNAVRNLLDSVCNNTLQILNDH